MRDSCQEPLEGSDVVDGLGLQEGRAGDGLFFEPRDLDVEVLRAWIDHGADAESDGLV